MSITQQQWREQRGYAPQYPKTDRTVCTLDDLAWLAVDVVAPMDRMPEGTDRHAIFRGYKMALLKLQHDGGLRVDALPLGDAPGSVRVFQSGAIEWWNKTFYGLPAPACIAEIIEPAPVSNPAGDYDLARMAEFAGWSEPTNRDAGEAEARRRLVADYHSGALPWATKCLSGNFWTQTKVTRLVAFEWLKRNRYAIPTELRDLETG
jgi:hypothetical protein